MISSLSGVVRHVGPSSAVVEVSGFGMLVQATPQTLSNLHTGRDAVVHTSMVVREESMTLFGFADSEERGVFETLLSVAGIGPRLALAILAVHTPEDVRVAASSGDAKAFTRVPGVGPKGAQRIVLELAGKLVPTGEAGGRTPAGAGPAWKGQVLEALTGLGWSEKDAVKAVDASAEAMPELVAEGNVGEILRAVLRDLGRGTARTGR
ncbi:Holliday junction branch migration protein RuvA [Arthrobacter sp. KK5.5]|uniref:Holliday junction branch migration protein RuvA n=1 Tax=Arthrobacter sp. KK5.5 TaxID=3373084 RepID=UPI003EE747A0